ncbi:MAG: TraB/GumN family protein, partial [Amphiplicatus sp.]
MNCWLAKSALWKAAMALAFFATSTLRAQETDAHAPTSPADDPIAALIAAETDDDQIIEPPPAVVQEPQATLSDDDRTTHPLVDEMDDKVSAPPTGVARPPMWRIADADSEVWLVGTFNILPENLTWRSNALLRAADLAETLWLEVEADRPDAAEKTMQILSRRGVNPPGVTLTSLLSAEDAARLEEIAGRLGLPMAAVDRMRPWQAFLVFNVQFIASQGYDPESGIQTSLLTEGRARGRHVVFFETI